MEMEEFMGRTPPKYAILSHRWSDGAEVTYVDYMDGSALSMPAYDKVLSFCSKARSEGLQYAWIDTCCIDKRSSAELSESINSMFKWYQQAEICYAYLNDVTKDGADFFARKDRMFESGLHMDVHPNDIWEKQRQTRLHREFCNSVWFKRGWTLQELVAPSEVVFFDSNWHDLGTKHSLVSLIHKITRIDIGHLQAASAEDIVRWASYQTFSVYAHLEYKNATGGTEEGLQQPYLSHKTAIQLIYVGTEPYGLLKVLGDSSARGFVPFQNQCDLHIEAGDRNWLIFIKADSRGNLTTFALFVGRLENSDKLWTHIEFPASSNDAAYWTMPMNRMDREHDVRIPQFNSPQGSEADYRSDGIYEGLTTRDLEGTNGGVVVVRRRKARGWPGDPEDVNVVIEGVDNRPLSMADEGPQEESPVSDEDGPNEEDDACRSGASTPQSPGGASLLDLPPGFDRFSLWEGFAGFNIPHPFADDDGVPENWYSLSFREMLNHVPKRLIHQFEQQQKQKQKQQGDILVKDPDSPQKQ
ncbi:hypothetical protein PG985_000307 [Apiospora marii]|uniref:uncharacterized protein n=1 Tax=Apiospora marii TaxID=335849 RepID=UPI00312D5955